MKRVFVDTNILLQFFHADEPQQNRKAVELFKKAQSGEIALASGPPVIFEFAWTLRSKLRMPREKILELLEVLLEVPGFIWTDARLIGEAVALARARDGDFADAYIVVSARMAGAEAVATFNERHFRKLGAEIHPLKSTPRNG